MKWDSVELTTLFQSPVPVDYQGAVTYSVTMLLKVGVKMKIIHLSFCWRSPPSHLRDPTFRVTGTARVLKNIPQLSAYRRTLPIVWG